MSLYFKLLIALIVAGTVGGGYYAYTQYQEKQEVKKTRDMESKILNAKPRTGIY